MINVKDFGAVGGGYDPDYDDTEAIQEAIDTASADEFSQIYFPTGVYRVTGKLTFDRNNLQFVGLAGATLFGDFDTGDPLVEGEEVENVSFVNLSFRRRQPIESLDSENPSLQQAISLDGAERITVQNCEFDILKLYLRKASHIHVRDCFFHDQWWDPEFHAGNPDGRVSHGNVLRALEIANLSGDAGDVRISRCRFRNSYSCIWADNVNDLLIDRNLLDTTAANGIVDRCTANITYRKSILNNTILNAGKAAIKVLDANNCSSKGHHAIVSGNHIQNWGLKTSHGAILSNNYYYDSSSADPCDERCRGGSGNNSGYNAEEESEKKATDLRIVNNTIIEDEGGDSAGQLFNIGNTKGVIVEGNYIDIKNNSSVTAHEQTGIPMTMLTTGWNEDVHFVNNVIRTTTTLAIGYENKNVRISGNTIFTGSEYNPLLKCDISDDQPNIVCMLFYRCRESISFTDNSITLNVPRGFRTKNILGALESGELKIDIHYLLSFRGDIDSLTCVGNIFKQSAEDWVELGEANTSIQRFMLNGFGEDTSSASLMISNNVVNRMTYLRFKDEVRHRMKTQVSGVGSARDLVETGRIKGNMIRKGTTDKITVEHPDIDNYIELE